LRQRLPKEVGVTAKAQIAQLINDCEEQRDTFIHSIALLKRNALAAPFELAFRKQKELESSSSGQGDLMAIHYRDEEAIYIQAAHDRVTVIFSTVFREETDRIFGKVFLQVCLIHLS
jgi:actin related protein 2/3 complex subunit 2